MFGEGSDLQLLIYHVLGFRMSILEALPQLKEPEISRHSSCLDEELELCGSIRLSSRTQELLSTLNSSFDFLNEVERVS
ncbi:hypothetical protein Pla110_28250 [Polystyrenella longa]|uniref:Uncharacterized protein n=1 Tax=Polystyrenella longa TaxID=2528007 RepID=A0A518CPD9_9PLAN|nr:hypothetical protein Pla110_28250 [Polystyrenella longa]